MSCQQTTVKAGHQTFELTPTQCAGLDLLDLLRNSKGEEACGEHACVYTTSKPDTLLKITDDADDVFGFAAAKGLPVVPTTGTPVQLGNESRYAFTVAKVQLPDVRDQIILNNVVNHGIVGAIFDHRRPKDEQYPVLIRGKNYRFNAPDYITDVVESECKDLADRVESLGRKDLGTRPEVIDRCRYIGNTAVNVIEKLGQRGVTFTDTHAGNWGFHKGRLVAIDLGLSHAPKGRRLTRLQGAMLPLRWSPPWR